MDARPDPDGAPKRKPNKLSALAVRVLHNPVQLRVVMMVVIFGGWYAAAYGPLSAGIDETARRTEREKTRLALATEVERLRAQVDTFKGRLPTTSDRNEWVQFMLAGVRGFPLRLVLLDTDGEKDVGPYKAVVIKMEIEGSFEEVDRFLRWIETNQRLLRVDSVRLVPQKDADKMAVNLIVLGVMG